jgi:hypothetical protein
MKTQSIEEDICEEIDDLPVSAALAKSQQNPYGSVPGLDDEELADPEEIERVVMWQVWGPVLRLRSSQGRTWTRSGRQSWNAPDWEALGMVECQEPVLGGRPAWLVRNNELSQLWRVLGALEVVATRLPGRARRLLLKYVQSGLVEIEHVADLDMRAVVKLFIEATSRLHQIERRTGGFLHQERQRLASLLAEEPAR